MTYVLPLVDERTDGQPLGFETLAEVDAGGDRSYRSRRAT